VENKDDEIYKLRIALVGEWLSNHAEHCEEDWPHEGDCRWPIPSMLPSSVVSEFLLESEDGYARPRQQ
jgi:hypothetical protein